MDSSSPQASCVDKSEIFDNKRAAHEQIQIFVMDYDWLIERNNPFLS